MSEGAEGLAGFGFELGLLKRVRRSGWWHVGVKDPESVAEHTMRTAQLAALIAVEEGADPARAAFLALWHDSQETRTGDLPHTATPYMTKPDPRRITADQTQGLPGRSRDMVREAVDEYETGVSIEARCAKDADKVEMLLQAIEYRDAGVARTGGWVDSARKDLHTETGRRVAEAAVQISPLSWRDR
ncbi:HD domain-containing protein [Winogradskya humida]|uniref:5'-deoxynucleotidase n=1 Tax=Winogradskya humida TaxID=113566 RepID=A0ABQ4A349_9ACTN|nr:HD domain-containing protein [Actinoplanes humidus]GIE24772.1 haloacid dehalogenase [Actinoplanes humidus]